MEKIIKVYYCDCCKKKFAKEALISAYMRFTHDAVDKTFGRYHGDPYLVFSDGDEYRRDFCKECYEKYNKKIDSFVDSMAEEFGFEILNFYKR